MISTPNARFINTTQPITVVVCCGYVNFGCTLSVLSFLTPWFLASFIESYTSLAHFGHEVGKQTDCCTALSSFSN